MPVAEAFFQVELLPCVLPEKIKFSKEVR